MIRTAKVLLLVSAATVLGGFAATAASATISGHFVSEQDFVTLTGAESGTEKTELNLEGLEIQCKNAAYDGVMNGTTAQQLTITPIYANCVETGEAEKKVEVKTNGCVFNVRSGREEEDDTAELACPAGKRIELIGTCTIKISPQVVKGLEYTTVTVFGKHAVTVDVTVKNIAMELHGFICEVFLGTNFTAGELTGSVQINALGQEGQPVGITETDGPAPIKFRSEAAHTLLTGAQSAENVYTFGILMGSVKCSTTSVSGTTAVQATEEITLTPTYSGCKGLERDVTVDMNGCAYKLKVTGSFVIECPAEKSIETTYDSFSGGCTLTIGAQTASGKVDLKNEGAEASRDILLTWTVEGLKYKRDGCEVGGEESNGTYSGSVTLKGQNTAEEQIGFWFGS